LRTRLISVFSLVMLIALTVVAKENAATTAGSAPRAVVAALEHNFGTLKPGTPLTFTFKVKNEGDATLEITNVKPACGCTSGDFDKTVAPGKEGKIKLSVPETESYRGEVSKTATVTTNDPDRPSFTLTLKATFATE
jgi:hypothetical protein